MQILHGLYQVGGSLGGITKGSMIYDFDDCNTYVLRIGDRSVMIDCGNGGTIDQIFDNMRYWGLPPDSLSICLLTHPHLDHAGGAYILKERGVRIISHPATAEAIASGDERCCGFLYHREFTPCTVDETLEDGQSITIDGVDIAAIHLPGHTMGCTAYALTWEGRRIVFSGDVIGTLGFGHFGWSGSIDFDREVYIKSLIKFSRMDFHIMLPGHGLIYFNRPRCRVEEALNEALMQWR